MNKKLVNKLKKNIRVIPNLPKKGILFQDITSITDNKKLFTEVINEISKYASKQKFSKIAILKYLVKLEMLESRWNFNNKANRKIYELQNVLKNLINIHEFHNFFFEIICVHLKWQQIIC